MHRTPRNSLIFLLALACQSPAVLSRVADGGPGSSKGGDGGGGSGGEGGKGSSGFGGFGGFPDAGPAGTGDPFGDVPKCAEDIHMAERVPLDLVLLVDRSMSMAGPKWEMTTKALTSFVSDARSAGLGVGLQYFPVSPIEHPCATATDCGGGLNPACFERRVCLGAGLKGIPPSCGGPRDPGCPAGSTCVPLGLCALSSTYCTGLGKPCPDGPPTDLCTAIGKVCQDPDFAENCSADSYRQLNVRIGPLPLAQAALVAIISATRPDGGTPMAAAVEGTMGFLTAYAKAHPDRRVVLILATDGVPSTCSAGNPANDIDMRLSAARMMTPSIATYTIGVFAPNEGPAGPAAVNRFAMAGGTGMGFVLEPTGDLTEKLLGTLNQIRGAALPCEFTIPTPKSGMLDFDRVNVHFKGASTEENVPYVGAADKCDPMRGGWYYDVDPSMTKPTKVVVCPKTCDRFKAEPLGQVQIGFGCKTIVIQ
jgi:hypothetical protein